MPPLSPQRLIAVGAAVFLILLFFFSATHSDSAPIQAIKDGAQSTVNTICNNDRPYVGAPTFQKSIHWLYDSIRVPVTAKTYTDSFGRTFDLLSHEPVWTESLGSKVLIVDMDTRVPNSTNELLNPDQMNWESLNAKQDGGMVSAALMNHFLYAQIHGYDYKFHQAEHMGEGVHDTWIKPHVLQEYLHSYQFVIFIDADATIQHLELPFEWLFNRWGITPNTSVAMPIDTAQILNGNENTSMDSKGKIALNTGLVITQALPLTFEMLTAWKTCPQAKRYPECGYWADHWSHEQRAFSEYIRYDFNPDNTNIVEIPCDDAMGYPFLMENHPHIISNCTGQFMRHHTIDKDMTKTSHSNAVLQNMAQMMQQALFKNANEMWVREGEATKGFMDKFMHGDDEEDKEQQQP